MQNADAAAESMIRSTNKPGEVINIAVTRYRRPSPHSEKTLSNAVVTVRGVGLSGEPLRGYGEVPFRTNRTGGGISATREFLQAAIREFKGFTVDLSSRDAARGSLMGLGAQIRQIADAAGDGSERPFAGARFGIETAFGDVAAKGLQIGLGELLSGESHQASIVRPIRARGASGSIRRESLERVLHTLPSNAAIPIDLRGTLSFERAQASLGRLIDIANSLEIAHTLVIHRPLRARDVERWLELEEHLRNVSSRTALKPVLRLAQDLTRNPSVEVRSAQDVTLMPAAAGGLIESFEQMRAVVANGAERIALVDAEGSDSIGYAALKALATSMPGVTVLLRPSSGDGGQPEGHGHGGEPDWQRILEGYREAFAVGEVPHRTLDLTSYSESMAMRRLGASGVSSALLQSEALRRGLRTRRTTRGRFTVNLDDDKVSFSPDGNPSLASDEGSQFLIEQTLANALADEGIAHLSEVEKDDGEEKGNTGFTHTGVKEEQHLSVLAFGTETLSALRREPLSVVGDGIRTVAELLIDGPLKENRETNHPWAAVDERVARRAVRHGVELGFVPALGEVVFLSSNLGLSRGAITRDILSDLPGGLRQSIENALKAAQNDRVIELDLLVTTDHEEKGRVVRLVAVDSSPLLAQFAYPLVGAAQDVISPIAHKRLSATGDESESPRRAIRVSVRGRVTRVAYRAWAQRLAEQLSLTGWARNVTDARVELVAAGHPLALAVLAARALQGPSKAEVNSVTTTPIEVPDVSGFAIVRKRPVPITRINRGPAGE